MPAGPKDTIWKAEPHTIAKIAILEAYLIAYFHNTGPHTTKPKTAVRRWFCGA